MKLARIEAASRLVLEFIEVLNQQEISKMLNFLSADCIFEAAEPAPHGTVYRGKEVIGQAWQQTFAQKEQLHFEIE